MKQHSFLMAFIAIFAMSIGCFAQGVNLNGNNYLAPKDVQAIATQNSNDGYSLDVKRIQGVSLTATSSTVIYTVPAKRSYIPLEIVIEPKTAITGGTCTVTGSSVSIVPATALNTNGDTTLAQRIVLSSTAASILNAGDKLKFNVSASGTSGKVDVVAIGYSRTD
jgi:hypothetical protein